MTKTMWKDLNYKLEKLNETNRKKTLLFIVYMYMCAIIPPILILLTAIVLKSDLVHNVIFLTAILIWFLLAIVSANFANKWFIRHQIFKQNGESKDSEGNEKERCVNEEM